MAAALTIAVIGTGDMGSAVGGALVRAGLRAVTDGSGRSEQSRALAAAAGIEDLSSLAAVVREADAVLSIVPPVEARAFAAEAAAAMRVADARPVFVDCNAVAPATVQAIARVFASLDAPFVDVGIVGRGPAPGVEPPTRFFVSGPAARGVLLGLDVPGIRTIDMGEEIGAASAIKMAYAALNKGTDALHAAVLVAAERLGVRAELMRELELSQKEALKRMRARVPYLAATAQRFAGEMAEIAATFDAAGVTPLIHRGAQRVFEELAATPLARETRATLPAQRSLDEALAVFCTAGGAPRPRA
jgi:3-hydroxyisobutyrate dehydrogenase-like beta-hydroxyacid dehydrogenase